MYTCTDVGTFIHYPVYMYVFLLLFSFIQERLEILLTVYDLDLSSDVTSSSDHLDDITIHPNITQASDTFTDIMSFTGFYSVSHVQLAFRLQCSPHYYGEDCSRYCIDTNDDTGHYSCDEAGDKLCLDGYQNPVTNCTECILSQLPTAVRCQSCDTVLAVCDVMYN